MTISAFVKLVAFFIFIGALMRLITKKKNQKRYRYKKDKGDLNNHVWGNKSQADRAKKSNYRVIKILNNEEERCFKALKQALIETKNFWHVFPQVSMGEVIKASNFDGFSVTNNKRFDFLIVDDEFNPKIAIEYNGRGHYQKNYSDRDRVKKIACEEAGLFFMTIKYDDNLGLKVRELREFLNTL